MTRPRRLTQLLKLGAPLPRTRHFCTPRALYPERAGNPTLRMRIQTHPLKRRFLSQRAASIEVNIIMMIIMEARLPPIRPPPDLNMKSTPPTTPDIIIQPRPDLNMMTMGRIPGPPILIIRNRPKKSALLYLKNALSCHLHLQGVNRQLELDLDLL